jgi:hypothetical protein
MSSRDQMDIDYCKLLCKLHGRKDEWRKEHRAIVIEFRNMVNDYDEKKVKLASELFKE